MEENTQWHEGESEITEVQRLTSGAIQKGVPTDVFLRSRALVSWAETPSGKKKLLFNHFW